MLFRVYCADPTLEKTLAHCRVFAGRPAAACGRPTIIMFGPFGPNKLSLV